jgi:hypothetical protein
LKGRNEENGRQDYRKKRMKDNRKNGRKGYRKKRLYEERKGGP